jgi:hypothetical protein
LSGELIELEKQRRAVASRIRSVDDALKLFGFEGDPNDIPARRKRGWIFRRGQLKRMVLAALRESSGPITNREIAASVIHQMGWDAEDEELHGLITGKVKDVRKRITKRIEAKPEENFNGN